MPSCLACLLTSGELGAALGHQRQLLGNKDPRKRSPENSVYHCRRASQAGISGTGRFFLLQHHFRIKEVELESWEMCVDENRRSCCSFITESDHNPSDLSPRGVGQQAGNIGSVVRIDSLGWLKRAAAN